MVMWFLVLYTQGQKSGETHTRRSWETFASYIGVWNLYNEYSDYFCDGGGEEEPMLPDLPKKQKTSWLRNHKDLFTFLFLQSTY